LCVCVHLCASSSIHVLCVCGGSGYIIPITVVERFLEDYTRHGTVSRRTLLKPSLEKKYAERTSHTQTNPLKATLFLSVLTSLCAYVLGYLCPRVFSSRASATYSSLCAYVYVCVHSFPTHLFSLCACVPRVCVVHGLLHAGHRGAGHGERRPPAAAQDGGAPDRRPHPSHRGK
jgi:hypothetical protein